MRKEMDDFPLKSAADIKLEACEMETCKSELLTERFRNINMCDAAEEVGVKLSLSLLAVNAEECCVPDEVSSYYELSKYIIDPNKHRFTKVVRILALVK